MPKTLEQKIREVMQGKAEQPTPELNEEVELDEAMDEYQVHFVKGTHNDGSFRTVKASSEKDAIAKAIKKGTSPDKAREVKRKYDMGKAQIKVTKEEVELDEMKKFKTMKTFSSEKEANDFLEKNDDYGVVGEKGGKVMVAKKSDMGESVDLDEAKKKDDDKDHDKGKGLDPVKKDQLKHDDVEDREDDDIDNDGDTDDSDQYLHTRRKAISKAVNKRSSKNKSDDEDED